MKRVTHIMAIIGFFVIAGAFGNDDVMMFSNVAYPFTETLKTATIGVLLMLPAIVEVINGAK